MARVSTPTRRPHRRFEGLVLSSAGARARTRLQGALRRAGLDGWRIAPLGPGAPHWFAVPPEGQRVGTARAWDLVYRLRDDRDVGHVEPAFETEGLVEPPARQPRRGRAPLGALFGRETDLTESNPHDWVIVMCKVREAWLLVPTPPGKNVVVAHPDTGYSDHPQLDAAAVSKAMGYDFVDDDPDPRDPLGSGSPGHGTATASVIVSADDAEVIGAAWGAKIVPLRVDTDVIHFSWRRLSAALYRAVAKNLPLASMSLGGAWSSATLDDAVEHARAHGMILIAAAGQHVGSVVYPARLPEVIAVAACNARSEPWPSSCSGPAVDITAPGVSVWRAEASAPGAFEVARSSGTSYATATTAAICALWLARHGGFAALAAIYGERGVAGVFKEALMNSARVPAGWDRTAMGAGIVDAEALLERPLPPHAPARGVRTAASRQRVPTAWERIEALFPGAEPDRVQGVVRSLFRPAGKAAARPVDLEPIVDELYFQIATDAALRAAIAGNLRGARKAKSARSLRLAIGGASARMRRSFAA